MSAINCLTCNTTAGADLNELRRNGLAFAERIAAWETELVIKKPLIGVVRGSALGGGCEMALKCDMLLCSTSAHFALPEVRHQTIPGCGGTQRLTAAVGKSRAMLMILSGDGIDAATADSWGLVAKVYPDDRLMQEALTLAERIAQHSPSAVSMARQAVNGFVAHSLSAMALERKLFLQSLAARAAVQSATEKGDQGQSVTKARL